MMAHATLSVKSRTNLTKSTSIPTKSDISVRNSLMCHVRTVSLRRQWSQQGSRQTSVILICVNLILAEHVVERSELSSITLLADSGTRIRFKQTPGFSLAETLLNAKPLPCAVERTSKGTRA